MSTDRPVPELSPREKQLLQYAAEGLTDTAIANQLGISEATVGTYWGRVRIKLGPYSRTELVAIVMRAEREAAVEVLRQENSHLVEALQLKVSSGMAFSYRELFDNAPDAMLLVSEDGTIEYANGAAQELFGYDSEAIHAAGLDDLVPFAFRNQHAEYRQTYFKDPQRRLMNDHLATPALHKSGAEFLIHAALSSISTPTGTIVMCAIRPQ